MFSESFRFYHLCLKTLVNSLWSVFCRRVDNYPVLVLDLRIVQLRLYWTTDKHSLSFVLFVSTSIIPRQR